TVRKWTWEGPPGHRRLVPPESPEPPDYESFEDRSPDDGPPDDWRPDPDHVQGSFLDGEDP
ncbi:MAG: hypothetical protein WAM97_02685, partial [Acidimicrobiales bacterium]